MNFENTIKDLLTRDWLTRALKTFVQASLGAAAVLAPTQDWSTVQSALVAVFIGAVSAGGAAVWNLLLAHFGGTTGTLDSGTQEPHQDDET